MTTHKLIWSLSLALALFTAAFSQTRSDRELAGLKGPVKTVVERSYKYTGSVDTRKSGDANSKFDAGDTVTYDPQGNEIERIMVSDYGELMGKQTQTFDKGGSLTERIFRDAKGALQERETFTYRDGRLVETLAYNAAGVVRLKTVRSYDGKGNLTEEVYHDPTIARARTVYAHDDRGNRTEMTFFMIDGKKAVAPVGPCLGGHRVKVTYDDKGRPIAKAVLDTEGNIKKSWTYSYDDSGNQLKQSMQSGGSTVTFDFKYEYDEKGNWIKSEAASIHSNPVFDTMFKAVGKTPTPEELNYFNEQLKRTSVTVRTIKYY